LNQCELKFPDKFKIMIGVNKNVRKRDFSTKNIYIIDYLKSVKYNSVTQFVYGLDIFIHKKW